MVQAMIEIPEEANHILNIIKARYNLKTKSEAIAKIVIECGENIIEPELRPEYLEKLQKIRKGKYIKFNSINDLRKATSWRGENAQLENKQVFVKGYEETI